MVDVCFRNMPYEKGQTLLGRSCQARSLYDTIGAMANYGIGRHHLHAFVLGTPELTAYVGQRRQDSLIRVDVADRLFVGRLPFLTGQDVVRKLGWEMQNPRTGLEPMIKAGIIQPEVGASTAEIRHIFSEPELEAALKVFLARFEPADPEQPNRTSTHGVSQTIGISSENLWRLLASGKIKTMGHVPDEGWVRGMRIDIKEVLAVVTSIEDPLNANEAAAILNVSPHQVRALTASERLPSSSVPDHLASKMTLVFARGDVDAFLAEFVSFKAARSMISGNPSFSRLGKMGLQPTIDLESLNGNESRTIFYKRGAVEAICQQNLPRAA